MTKWGIGAAALVAGMAVQPAMAQVTFNNASGYSYSYANTANSTGSNNGSGSQSMTITSPNDALAAISNGTTTTSMTVVTRVPNTPPFTRTNPAGGTHPVATLVPTATAAASGLTYASFDDAYSGMFGFTGTSSASTLANADASTSAAAYDYGYFTYTFTASAPTTVTVNYDVNQSSPYYYYSYVCLSSDTCQNNVNGTGTYTFNAAAGSNTLYASSYYGDYVSTTGPGATAQAGSLNDVYTFSIGAVPEPGTWALMMLGFGTVGGALRLRRTRKPDTATA